jgi:RND family efflux transporter MFP subunit
MVRSLGLVAIVGLWFAVPAAAQPAAEDAEAYNCVARPKSVVDLGSADQGILTELRVDRGDIVEKGTVVAQLDSQLQALNVELTRLKAESDVEIRSNDARIAFREAETKRAQDLHDREVVSTRALEEAKIEGHLAELALETSRLERQMAEVEHKQARVLHDRRSVRSPVAGVVVELSAATGEFVYEQKHLMQIAEIDPLHVEVYLPVSVYGEIEVGTVGQVRMDEPIGGEHAARVSVVDRVFDPESRTFGVRLVLPNPDYALPAGMICTVRFVYDRASGGDSDAQPFDSDLDLGVGSSEDRVRRQDF